MNTPTHTQSNVVNWFRDEIAEQPDRLRDLVAAYASDTEVRRQLVLLRDAVSPDRPVLWLGMGASLYSAMSGATRLCLLGRPSFAVEAGEWLHYGPRESQPLAAPILVTTSGASAELVQLCRRIGQAPNILLCNDNASPCWSAAQIRLPILAGTEWGNATKTYLNSTAACTIVASELAGCPWRSEADQVVRAVGRSLESLLQQRNDLMAFCKAANSIEFVGRGPSLGGAMMAALCFREMTGIRAAAYPGATFRHGPLLDVDSTHVAIILALGRTAELGIRLAKDCITRGGRVILVTAQGHVRAERLLPISIEPVPEAWEGITSALVGQALTLAFIERMGSCYVRLATVAE